MMAKPKAIQIPLSEKMRQRCPELFVWIESQENPNEATRKVLEHFIALYGTQSVDNEEIKLGMAKDLLSAKGMLQGDIPRGLPSKSPLTYKQPEEGNVIEKVESSIVTANEDNQPKDVHIEKSKEKTQEDPVNKPIERKIDMNKWTN
ncbi:hypothetical protein [Bacillus toyonensis]|uniref:Uncharacterized protein n=3 Tax=Bacillus TaxID=1386 RepID=A0ABD6S0T6_BACTU|nr:hypothetical protein [Bacillus toyonensis]PER37533.1 hypothetical protein CN495_34855 [Bacillus thuringiensis]PGN52541.1 hypothetical protein CN966_24790 [Bacillus cereus]PEU77014.1 hypothetical protein CN411_28770 [Bacillus thuringiensis]PFH98531.1 hypothetical protein COI79_33405 [Bacillus thuringiensis]PFW14848.1 hypothetical protein COL26_34895 [Bacillus thuringiensis]